MPTLRITNEDDGDLQANTANVQTAIYEYTHKQESILELGVGTMRPEVVLMTHDQFSGDGSTTSFSLNDDIVDAPHLADTDGNAVGFVGGSKSDLSSVDFSADSVTFSSAPASGTNNVDVFYVFRSGKLRGYVYRDSREMDAREAFTKESLNALHQRNQYKQPPQMGRVLVGPDMVVRLEMDSSTIVANDSDGNSGATPVTNEVRIPYKRRPLRGEWKQRLEQFKARM